MSQLRLDIGHDRYAQCEIARADIGATCSIRDSGLEADMRRRGRPLALTRKAQGR